MDIRLFQSDSKLLAKIGGRIVLDECDRFKSTLNPTNFKSVENLYIDLSDVDFIDSAGLGALVGVKVASTKAKIKLMLLSPSQGVQDILVVSKLDSIFEVISGAESSELAQSIQATSKPVQQEEKAGHQPVPNTPSVPRVPTPAPPLTNPKERIDQLCRDAVEFMRNADYESAVACYQEAISLNPDYLPAHNNLAIVYEKKPQWIDRAITQWHKVLEMSTKNNDQKHIDRANKHLNSLQRVAP